MTSTPAAGPCRSPSTSSAAKSVGGVSLSLPNPEPEAEAKAEVEPGLEVLIDDDEKS